MGQSARCTRKRHDIRITDPMRLLLACCSFAVIGIVRLTGFMGAFRHHHLLSETLSEASPVAQFAFLWLVLRAFAGCTANRYWERSAMVFSIQTAGIKDAAKRWSQWYY